MNNPALFSDPADDRATARSGFDDRSDAGRRLAGRLQAFRGSDVVVLGVPRGGVTVAYEIAARLRLPLDTLVVHKLPVPYRPDLAFGAIGEGVRIIDEVTVRSALLTTRELLDTEAHQLDRLRRRSERFRRHRPPATLAGRTALVVDDGVVTGMTARAACQAAYRRGAIRVVLAVPIAPHRILRTLSFHADKIVCLETPIRARPISDAYLRFDSITDADVDQLLSGHAPRLRRIRLAGNGSGAG
ncbi:putative phosphoribosyltransferase [Nocardia tenerifensis]|uniref:Putative phosphoribosyltransferase n=1 Tax=Nocardia tenerifensis TaxID=228006 RepID=A0A318JUK1_9NOCA|nr:phosphoribosyltransferase family protein [Nocardia tenerifensis]PXX60424.1 putative phosphoribosyltransferase [Nocardia tenerifensis]